MTDYIEAPLMTAEEAAAITVDAEQIAEALPRVMAEHGVAIIANVASADDVAALEAAFAADLSDVVDTKAANTCGGAVRNAAAKLEAASSAMPAASAPLLSLDPQVTPGFCSGRGLPGGRFAWQARTLPSVRRVYEVLHGTDDICVGLDHSFFSPGAAPAYQSNPSWPHVDLNTRDASVRDSDGVSIGQWTVYQGLLYCWSSESERASTTVVWPGSHLEPCDQIQASVDNGGHHFSMIGNVTDPAARASLMEGWTAGARRVPVPAGALLVWSSRTSHQGWSGGPRLAHPLCWEPKGRRSAAARDRKMRLAAVGLPTTHWASQGIPHGRPPCFPQPPTAARPGRGGQTVQLPMRSSLRPVTLRDGVELEQAWSLVGGSRWDRPLSEAKRAELEAMLRPEVVDVL